MERRTTRADERGRDVLARWVAAAPDLAAEPMTAAADDVVLTCLGRPAGTPGALRRFGRAAGEVAHPAGRVVEWVDLLDGLVPRTARRALRHREATVALFEGWAEASVRGADEMPAIDPTTGLGTLATLRSEDPEPPGGWRLVAVDVPADGLDPLTADAHLAHAARAMRAALHHAPAARVGRRLVALTDHDPATERAVTALADAVATSPTGTPTGALVWSDVVRGGPEGLAAYLRDLAEVVTDSR